MTVRHLMIKTVRLWTILAQNWTGYIVHTVRTSGFWPVTQFVRSRQAVFIRLHSPTMFDHQCLLKTEEQVPKRGSRRHVHWPLTRLLVRLGCKNCTPFLTSVEQFYSMP